MKSKFSFETTAGKLCASFQYSVLRLMSCFACVQVFSDVVELPVELSDNGFLRSTLSVPRATLSHAGSYHCSVEDGTDRGGDKTMRLPGLCREHSCLPFITASHPATVFVLGQSDIQEKTLFCLC